MGLTLYVHVGDVSLILVVSVGRGDCSALRGGILSCWSTLFRLGVDFYGIIGLSGERFFLCLSTSLHQTGYLMVIICLDVRR